MAKIQILAIFCVFTVSPVAHAQSIGFSISDNSSDPTHLSVNVMDDQTMTPIRDASVSITDAVGFGPIRVRQQSFSDGKTRFSNLSISPKTVSVTKAGYATVSVVGVQGSEMTVYLKPLKDTTKTVIVSGTLSGWEGVGDDDKIMSAGLVFRTVSAIELLDFQISNFISPLRDQIDLGSLVGSKFIPSNLAIPQQSVSYLFFNIDLNKPRYRLSIPASDPVQLTAVEGEMAVSDVVSLVQSKKYTAGLLNKVTVKHVGFTQKFSVDRDIEQNVDATLSLVPTHQVSITQAPPFQADVLAASFTDQNGDKSVLIPSDAKAIVDTQSDNTSPQTVTLSAPEGTPDSSHSVATVALGSMGRQISGILVSPAGPTVQTGEFLNTDALPQEQGIPATVSVHAPAQGIGAAIFTSDQPIWYVYSLPAAGTVSIPTDKVAASATLQSYSVNQMEFSQFDEKSIDGSKILSSLQRFARSSAKLK